MDVDLLFPEAFAFRYSNISAHSVSFGLLSSSAFGNCPLCRKPSSKVHSYYERKVQDLPISGKMVKLSITTRKFFCLEDTCPRKVFAERFGSYLMPHQRRLERSNGQIQAIGLSCGSKPGASVCEVIGLPVSASTILRIMKRTILPEVITPKVLGVDEVDLMLRIIGPCAFKKGHRYGTILVDLEQRRPIDLLPDREGETLQEWLKAHPGVEIITRDRSPVYANAITEACPIATQVADRWHLLKNLSEERYLDTQRPLIRAVAEELNQQQIEQLNSSVNHTSMDPPSKTLNPDTIEAPLTKATPSGKQYQKYEQAKLLQQQGHSRRAIARHLGLSRNTVNKYFRQESYLPRSTKRDSKVLKFEPYLRKRWLEGETCVKTLLEINTLGYTGGYTILTAFLAAYPRVPRADVLPAARKGATLSGRNLSIALCRKEEEWNEDQKPLLNTLLKKSELLQQCRKLCLEFKTIMEQKKGSDLESWCQKASQLHPFANFVKGIRQDFPAVCQAMSSAWSNGQTEGQVNRLKNIKRQMYGKASFQLLRLRVLTRAG